MAMLLGEKEPGVFHPPRGRKWKTYSSASIGGQGQMLGSWLKAGKSETRPNIRMRIGMFLFIAITSLFFGKI
jgi:hypothetical protein